MPTDDKVYYEATRDLPQVINALVYARTQMFRLFMSEMKPTAETTILDIGASEAETPETNFIEKLYPHKSKITCAGIGDGKELRALNPEVSYVPITPGTPLPFPDKSFDIAYSNAVLEHVGGTEQRRVFLKDALRVARTIFFAIPNRWFPVEHHTGIPLLHYSPALFRKITGGTKLDYWSHKANLDFLDMPLLRSEWPEASPPKMIYTGIRCGVFSSNIAIVARS